MLTNPGFRMVSSKYLPGTGIAKFISEIIDSLAEFLRVCGLFTKNQNKKITL